MIYLTWIGAVDIACTMASTMGRKYAVIAVVNHRFGQLCWLWKVVPAGGSEHRAHRAFLDEQRELSRCSRARSLVLAFDEQRERS